MRVTILAVFGLSLLLSSQDKNPDSAKVQGMWHVIEINYDGKNIGTSIFPKKGWYIFVGDKVISLSGDQVERISSFELESDVNPKKIDITFSNGKESKGIYKFEKDFLIMCIANPGVNRPRSFDVEKDSMRIMSKLKKIE